MNWTPEQILILVVVIMAVWYVLASIYNRRRGLNTYRWLRDGLEALGSDYQGKWLGSSSSGAHITVNKAQSPFRRVEVIFLLESRELLPLWLVDIWRDKRDQIILKATVRSPWPAEVEIVPANSRLANHLRAERQHPWIFTEAHGLLIAGRGPNPADLINRFRPILERYGPQVRHISWSKSAPQLITIFALAELLKSSPDATELFTTIRDTLHKKYEV